MGTKLNFAPVGSCMINANPGAPVQQGLPIRRAGRTFDPKTRKYPADREPFTCDVDSPLGKYCLKIMSRRDATKDEGRCAPLFCMDEQTAKRCGSPHVVKKPEWKDGTWADPNPRPKPNKRGPQPQPKGKTSPTAGGKG